jgi:hypothetical protein
MTSFGSREMTASHPHDRSAWMRYLPLAPSPPHPMSGIQLVLKNGAVLEKPSYIQRACYEISPEVLAHYTRGVDYLKRSKALKLTDGSLKQLLVHMPSPVPWTPVSILPQPVEVKPENPLPDEKSASRSTHAEVEPIGSLAPRDSLCDVKITMGSNALDDGTFDKLLRLCGVANIEVTVTPAQTSVAPYGGFDSMSGPQTSPHLATSAQEASSPRQTQISATTASSRAWLAAAAHLKHVGMCLSQNLNPFNHLFHPFSLYRALNPPLIALYGTASLLVYVAASLIRRGPTMTYLAIMKILKLGFRILCRTG